MILLELNDAGLGLQRDGETIYRQPAIAHVNARRCVFGLEALRIARLHPQQTNQQYLARLNADPLTVPGKLAANHADLVYLHLLELKTLLASDADPDLVAAVPGSLSNDQLGVLLGIAQEAGLDIRGFVDAAVLMASAAALPEHCWLLDLHLTRACLTELRAGGEVVRSGVETLPGCGLISCLDGWANLLADRFVQETRFDPLHAADTEQQLFDQLYDWAQSGRHGEPGEGDFVAEIRHGGHERRVQVADKGLQGKLSQRFQQVAQKLPEGARLLVAPRTAALPGLMANLAALGIRAERLPDDALARGFARHVERITAGPLRLVNRLPCDGVAEPAQGDARPKATHALCENRAWPLEGNPFGLPRAGRAGDSVEHDGRRYLLIHVESTSIVE